VGALAHEIRNPLSTIRLNMELLAEDFENTDPDSPTKQRDRRAKAKIELVRQECDRLQKLLGDFLDFARQESLNLEPGSLNEERTYNHLVKREAPKAARATRDLLGKAGARYGVNDAHFSAESAEGLDVFWAGNLFRCSSKGVAH
jgi:signal transduction histidine kinase